MAATYFQASKGQKEREKSECVCVWVCVCVCVFIYIFIKKEVEICVCVCVRKRERERDFDVSWERNFERLAWTSFFKKSIHITSLLILLILPKKEFCVIILLFNSFAIFSPFTKTLIMKEGMSFCTDYKMYHQRDRGLPNFDDVIGQGQFHQLLPAQIHLHRTTILSTVFMHLLLSEPIQIFFFFQTPCPKKL